MRRNRAENNEKTRVSRLFFTNKLGTVILTALVPVGWCLQLGMFKEPKIPQTGGGHMRLIIGYNDKKDTIIYSDSWAAGHGKKEMPIANAYCMTNVLLAMPPTR